MTASATERVDELVAATIDSSGRMTILHPEELNAALCQVVLQRLRHRLASSQAQSPEIIVASAET